MIPLTPGMIRLLSREEVIDDCQFITQRNRRSFMSTAAKTAIVMFCAMCLIFTVAGAFIVLLPLTNSYKAPLLTTGTIVSKDQVVNTSEWRTVRNLDGELKKELLLPERTHSFYITVQSRSRGKLEKMTIEVPMRDYWDYEIGDKWISPVISCFPPPSKGDFSSDGDPPKYRGMEEKKHEIPPPGHGLKLEGNKILPDPTPKSETTEDYEYGET